MSARIETPFPIFTDTDGSPLEDGFLYIGEVNQNPEVVPTTVYWDENLTVPASQPIRTISGYPSRSGTIARVYLDVDYSITIRDKNSSLVSTSANETVDGGIGIIGNFATATGTVNALELDLPSVAAYADNMILDFQVTGANTGSMTIQINALGTKALVVNNSPIPSDTTIVNGYYSAVYNLANDNFELINHEFSQQIEDVEKIDKSVTQNVASDADITLTADQNLYGRIEITDTGVILTTGRNVITDNTEHSFLAVNSTAQTLTFKTAGGTGIAVDAWASLEVRNNAVNIIAFEVSRVAIASTAEAQAGTDDTTAISPLKLHETMVGSGSQQSYSDVSASRLSGVSYPNTTGRPIIVMFTNNSTNRIFVDGIYVGLNRVSNTVIPASILVPNGSEITIDGTFGTLIGTGTGFGYKWVELS